MLLKKVIRDPLETAFCYEPETRAILKWFQENQGCFAEHNVLTTPLKTLLDSEEFKIAGLVVGPGVFDYSSIQAQKNIKLEKAYTPITVNKNCIVFVLDYTATDVESIDICLFRKTHTGGVQFVRVLNGMMQ